MANIIDLLVIISLTYLIVNIEGPFGIFSKIRNLLLNNKYVGVFFYKLLSCYFCSGFWSGIIFCVLFKTLLIINIIYFGLLGAIISLITLNILNKYLSD